VPSDVKFRRTASEPLNPYVKWCKNDTEVVDGIFVGKEEVNEEGK